MLVWLSGRNENNPNGMMYVNQNLRYRIADTTLLMQRDGT